MDNIHNRLTVLTIAMMTLGIATLTLTITTFVTMMNANYQLGQIAGQLNVITRQIY